MAYLTMFFIFAGVLFMLLASIGILKMKDVYLRSHVASLAPTLGKIGILLALSTTFTEGPVIIKCLLIVVFLFITAPVAAHLMLRGAYLDGVPLSPNTVVNDYPEKNS